MNIKTLLIAVFALFFAGSAIAQPNLPKKDVQKKEGHRGGYSNYTPEERATKMTEKMSEKLNLTADQKSRVYEVNLASAQRMQVIKNEHKGHENADKPQVGQEMKAVRSDRETQIRQILTAEQLERYNQMKAESGKHKGNKGGKGYEKGAEKGMQKSGKITPRQN